MGLLQKSCLLIQIQNEPCFYKVLKNFELGYWIFSAYFKAHICKTIVIFQISTLRFIKIQSFMQKKKL